MDTSQGHGNLSDLTLLRVALGLSSPDALSLSKSCKMFYTTIRGSKDVKQVWRSMLDIKSARGIHGQNFLWLHALLDWSDIALYYRQTQRFMPMLKICFHSSRDLASLLAAVNLQKECKTKRMSSGFHDASIFLGEWHIPKDSIKVWKHTDSVGVLLGHPVQFVTDYGGFTVALQLSRILEDRFRLTWHVDLPLKTRMEAPYPLEVDVSGVLARPDRTQDFTALQSHNSFEDPHSQVHGHHADAGSDLSAFAGDEQVYKMLSAGKPVTCFTMIAVSCMGDRVSVRPVHTLDTDPVWSGGFLHEQGQITSPHALHA